MQQKKLRNGYTTGTCAQAATKAALQILFQMVSAEELQNVTVEIPEGKTVSIPICEIQKGWGEEKEESVNQTEETTQERSQKEDAWVSCAIKKDSGDDPDITNGTYIYSKVRKTRMPGIVIDGGVGIGRVTKPGLDQPVGAAAINSVPRRMIAGEVEAACEEAQYRGGIHVEISIPEGERLAKQTFNPRLGVVGGLSILGTSGIVKPMSEQALLDTIRVEIKVKLAQGNQTLIAAPGNYGLEFLKETYGILAEDVVTCSNYIGQTIDMAKELGCRKLIFAGHLGKMIKTAGGIMNTHSKWADCRMELFAAAALRAGADAEISREILTCLTTDDALAKCTKEEQEQIMQQLMSKMEEYLRLRAGEEMQVGAVTFSKVYGILGKTSMADELIGMWQRENTKKYI